MREEDDVSALLQEDFLLKADEACFLKSLVPAGFALWTGNEEAVFAAEQRADKPDDGA